MSKILSTLSIFAVSALTAISLLAPVVSAYDPIDRACSRGGDNSAFCQGGGGGNPLTGQDGIILGIANVVAIVAGVAAVIIIILAGLRYVTSASSAEDLAGARRTIIYAIVGLIVIALSRALLSLALSAIN